MFGFETYHIGLAGVGLAILIAFWLPRFVSGREPAASALLIVAGLLAFLPFPEARAGLDPVSQPRGWEIMAEICVIVGLFGTGLRIDRLVDRGQWWPTLRLLLIAMPLCIAALALFGWFAAGMTFAGALLLGAVLAPTDPVLAADVAVGPPLEGGEHPVRFTLTTEAGLNDGLAFPFVHLGILVAGAGMISWDMAGEWVLRDLLYRVVVGGLSGAAVGWLLGKLLFDWPRENALARTESGVIAFAGVLLAYGATELVEGYGFIAAFVAGLTLRRSESTHDFHKKLHDFSESLEHALTAILLVGLGAILPVLWPHFTPANALIAGVLILVIRPAAAWLSLTGTMLRGRERAVVAFYGVRGIGSIYYLAYAGHHVKLTNEYELWATIVGTILLSTLVHGLTAGLALDQVTGEEPPEPGEAAPERVEGAGARG
ncbi:NhaP-type Na+/H+ or K+/H+ antiporter [Sphingomonas kaistensis]|uniref:NhaP-type Na+/H+ or K+/H+ antiporter n=1 Tax=Sphingomonas kaistensis TaxID=298708 RepID=A0A7X5YAY9_9SPHN|nr:sodium:proton antiporter [Sphingomonas kaistensis]NJC06806.1 NhaP-type Na+/H+ or K+/H+ antiporter [Sphingomonas kaistensis]